MKKLSDEQRAIRKIEVKNYQTQWQRDNRARLAEKSDNKIQCQVCGLWYRKVGSHVWQVHKMSAREYRKEYGFDVKRGQLPEDDRLVMREHVFSNGTVDNLKEGKRFWFKPGSEIAGRYQRSEQTMERLTKKRRVL